MTAAPSVVHEAAPVAPHYGPNSLTSLFLLASHLLELRLDQALNVHGLTARKHRALLYIANNPGTTRVELADALGVSRQAAGALSVRMTNAGLVDRTCSGRGLPVSYVLTARGRRCLDRASTIIAATERNMVADLSSVSLDSLVKEMHELIHEIS